MKRIYAKGPHCGAIRCEVRRAKCYLDNDEANWPCFPRADACEEAQMHLGDWSPRRFTRIWGSWFLQWENGLVTRFTSKDFYVFALNLDHWGKRGIKGGLKQQIRSVTSYQMDTSDKPKDLGKHFMWLPTVRLKLKLNTGSKMPRNVLIQGNNHLHQTQIIWWGELTTLV